MTVPWKLVDARGARVLGLPKRRTEIKDVAYRALTLQQLRDLRQYVKRLCKTCALRETRSPCAHRERETGSRIAWSMINQYDVVDLIFKLMIPQGDNSCSWAELVAEGPQKPRFYVSHWCVTTTSVLRLIVTLRWGGSFRDFGNMIDHHARQCSTAPDDAYWFCVTGAAPQNQ